MNIESKARLQWLCKKHVENAPRWASCLLYGWTRAARAYLVYKDLWLVGLLAVTVIQPAENVEDQVWLASLFYNMGVTSCVFKVFLLAAVLAGKYLNSSFFHFLMFVGYGVSHSPPFTENMAFYPPTRKSGFFFYLKLSSRFEILKRWPLRANLFNKVLFHNRKQS